MLLQVACATPTEPGTDPDVDQFPYRLSPTGVRVFGTSRILVIPARFADGLPISIGATVLGNRFFGSGSGELTQTFRLASGASFALRGDVTNWFQSSVTVAAARGPGPLSVEGEQPYVIEAIEHAAAIVDYGRYDNDGPDGKPNSGDDDGLVDGGVVILNSELNVYCSGGRGPHPHALTQWRVGGQPLATRDPRPGGGFVSVGGYVLMSATGCSPTGNVVPTLAHELGHLLFGLPDIYQPFGVSVTEPWTVRRWVLGCWELMAAGSGWGCGSGTPLYDGRVGTLGAWTRGLIGWVNPTVIPTDRDASYELFALGHGGTVLRLPIREGEYLLLEYREPQPGDALPPAAGVLVYHVADSLPLYPPTPARFSRVSLIEADDDDGLTRTELEGGNRGVAADAFGAVRKTLSPAEHRRFTAIDGTPLPFELLDISLDPSRHRATLRVAPINP